MRYEHDNNDDSQNLWRGGGGVPPAVPPPGTQRFITEKSTDDVDLFSGHATTVTRFSDSFWLTTAYSYTSLIDDIGGSRIYGTTYNAAYNNPVPTLGSRDHGYLNLAGTTQVKQWVINLNTMWVPLKDLTVLARFALPGRIARATRFTSIQPSAKSRPSHTPPTVSRTSIHSPSRWKCVTPGHQLAFYARGEWEEQYGDIHENETAIDVPPVSGIKDLSLLWQKYTAGFNWYPLDRINLSAQYFYKSLQYDNSSTVAGQQLVDQEWDTNDVNIRLTWRPRLAPSLGTLSLVTRYDYATVSVYGQWAAPDLPPLQSVRTALITNHMISESLTWNPTARLYFQGNVFLCSKQDEHTGRL